MVRIHQVDVEAYEWASTINENPAKGRLRKHATDDEDREARKQLKHMGIDVVGGL